MTQEKGLLFFILTVVSALLYTSWFGEKPPSSQEKENSTAVIAQEASPVAEQAPRPKELLLALSPRVRFSNDKISGSVQQKGLSIDDLDLKDYKLNLEENRAMPLLAPDGTQDPYFVRFGWVSPDKTVSVPDAESFWDLKHDNGTGKNVELSFSKNGLEYTYTMVLDDEYMAHLTMTVRNTTATAVQIGGYARLTKFLSPEYESSFVSYEGPIGYMEKELKDDGYKTLDDEVKSYQARQGEWAGFSTKYWLTALIPSVENEMFSVSARSLQKKRVYAMDVVSPTYLVQPGETKSVSVRFFAGPKQRDLLSAYADKGVVVQLEQAIDYGYFSFITRPTLILINWLYELLKNFGFVIIVLTILVRLSMFPLARKSHNAMVRMRKLQPKLKMIQEMYANDRMRLQQEMANFYRTQKINPLSGCLPMLVQMPVFFALYKVLFISLEMRHAPFFGWLKDLSCPDPTSVLTLFGLIPIPLPSFLQIGVLPILMGVTMYFQQKLSPQTMDPNQQKVMRFLPLVFMFMLASFPAGLTLYWTVSNLISILQQWFIGRGEQRG